MVPRGVLNCELFAGRFGCDPLRLPRADPQEPPIFGVADYCIPSLPTELNSLEQRVDSPLYALLPLSVRFYTYYQEEKILWQQRLKQDEVAEAVVVARVVAARAATREATPTSPARPAIHQVEKEATTHPRNNPCSLSSERIENKNALPRSAGRSY